MMKLIRALTFDLDNTLWETDVSILRAENVMAHHLKTLTPFEWMAEFNLETFHALRKVVVKEQPQIAHNLTTTRMETLKRWFENRGATSAIADDLAKEGFRVLKKGICLGEYNMIDQQHLASLEIHGKSMIPLKNLPQ